MLQDSTVLVCSGDVVNGSVKNVLISDDGISGTCQHPWSPMESLVWKLVNTHGVP